MRKLTSTLMTLICLLGLVFTASQTQAQAYRQGELAISGGIGFGAYGLGGYYGGIGSLPLVFHGEYGIIDIVSGGAFVGFRFWNPDFNLAPNVAIGVRASGHLFPILNKYANTSIDDEKADVYLAVLTGLEVRDNISNRYIIGTAIGGKYYFAGPLGAFVELGTGALTYGTIGVILHFGGE